MLNNFSHSMILVPLKKNKSLTFNLLSNYCHWPHTQDWGHSEKLYKPIPHHIKFPSLSPIPTTKNHLLYYAMSYNHCSLSYPVYPLNNIPHGNYCKAYWIVYHWLTIRQQILFMHGMLYKYNHYLLFKVHHILTLLF